ncbi:MAG: sulfotransferase domain-containing protein [Proteobacteria bacterium]|nr:sulfotransferase domain-containing protein [Pseudomonadota bacterium]
MAYVRRFVSGIRSQLYDAIGSVAAREYLPSERRDDDLFFVEFPKSGVTWLTFLVANTNVLLNGDRRKITFFNINDFVPDIQLAHHMRTSGLPLPGYRCFKSHSPYTRYYRKVCYLVRDPRHVMVSYWAFLTGLGWWKGTLEQLVTHPHHGIAGWVDHVSGWLHGVDAAAAFTLIRYEDLLADTPAELKRLYALLGMPVTDELLATAVSNSGIDMMRSLEAELAASHPALKGYEFVRRKSPGGTREPLPHSVSELIVRKAGDLMKRLGYSTDGVGNADASNGPR